MEKFRQFVSRNSVLIVMVPFMLATHYGWSRLQDIEELVPKEEKKPHPIFLVMDAIKNKVTGGGTSN